MMGAFRLFFVAFGTVFVAMVLLTAALFLLRTAGRRFRATGAGGAPGAEGAAGDGELVAVLAAAAYEALGHPVKIHRVHLHREAATDRWSGAGRMDIMISHRVEPKR